jgi:3-oxoacyl-[acyl-carrier-protein] synthase II
LEFHAAITGYGMINHLGMNAQAVWQRIQENHKTEKEAPPFNENQGASGIDIEGYFEKKEMKRLDSFAHYAIASSMEALSQANIRNLNEKQKMGVYIGASGNGADKFLLDNHSLLLQRGPKRVSPYYSSASMINSPPAEIAIKHGLHGPSGTIIAGETSSLMAIGQGLRAIRNKETTLMLAGGTQGDISNLTKVGYESLKITSPDKNAYNPFTANSQGAVLRAGAGSIVMESMKSAVEREIDIKGIIMGFSMGTCSDHLYESYVETIQSALSDAKVTPEEVSLVIPQGSGIPTYDKAEKNALHAIFSKGPVAACLFKKETGNLIAANGVTNTILSLLFLPSLRDKKNTRFSFVQELNESSVYPNRDLKHKDIALINCFDFHGHNASLVVKLA